jgi:hypothetical protein
MMETKEVVGGRRARPRAAGAEDDQSSSGVRMSDKYRKSLSPRSSKLPQKSFRLNIVLLCAHSHSTHLINRLVESL